MDIIKWIKKNNFKDIDGELSDQIDKLSVLQTDKEKLIGKIKSYKTNLSSLKESLDIVNGKISKANKKALKSLKVLPIISIGFDARSSTYICIVKYAKSTKSTKFTTLAKFAKFAKFSKFAKSAKYAKFQTCKRER